MPEYFHAQGYRTVGIGKIQHTPEQVATIKYDSFDDPGSITADEKKQRKKTGGDNEKKKAARELPDEEEPDGIIARRAVKVVEEPREKPLFLAVGLHRPHAPSLAPQKYFDMYPQEKMPLLAEPKGHTAGIPRIANPPKYHPEMSEKKFRGELQTYYACASFMDAQIGVLLDGMDRLKLWDNTIVLLFRRPRRPSRRACRLLGQAESHGRIGARSARCRGPKPKVSGRFAAAGRAGGRVSDTHRLVRPAAAARR
jgi:uncharacterized sulfatase